MAGSSNQFENSWHMASACQVIFDIYWMCATWDEKVILKKLNPPSLAPSFLGWDRCQKSPHKFAKSHVLLIGVNLAYKSGHRFSFFSKSSNVPILQIWWMISETYPILKSLTELILDLIFEESPSHLMWVTLLVRKVLDCQIPVLEVERRGFD